MLRLAGRRLSSLSSTAPSWRSAASAASLSWNPISSAASDSSSPFFPGQIKPNAVDSHFAFFPRFDFHHRGFASESLAPKHETGFAADAPATAAAGSKTVYRPLSPHLTIYKPQMSSTTSIFNRMAGSLLAALVLFFYLVCVKMGTICFTYDAFYQFLFYSSKLTLISVEISVVALSYHIIKSLQHLIK